MSSTMASQVNIPVAASMPCMSSLHSRYPCATAQQAKRTVSNLPPVGHSLRPVREAAAAAAAAALLARTLR